MNWTVSDAVYAVGGRAVAGRTGHQVDGRWGWLCYFAVDDIDVAGNRVLELGGTVVDWARHPLLGDTVVFRDPVGVVSALAGAGERWGGQHSGRRARRARGECGSRAPTAAAPARSRRCRSDWS
ncbi:VOC family protein [Saccharopolyspora spinosporotrichia]